MTADHISRSVLPSLAVCAFVFLGGPSEARSPATDARAGIQGFVENCFSPRMTAAIAAEALNFANVRHDFYDLDPFTDAAPSPVTARPATPGTDRRCEVAFDGDFTADAGKAIVNRLERIGITRVTDLPANHEALRTSTTTLLAARRLNPRKIAVVHVGTRPGPNGIEETFMYVERLRLSQ